jgi:hypothetical protein
VTRGKEKKPATPTHKSSILTVPIDFVKNLAIDRNTFAVQAGAPILQAVPQTPA